MHRVIVWGMFAMVLLLCVSAAARGTKIALVVDIAGRGDVCPNDLAIAGCQKACTDFGYELDVLEPASMSDYRRILTSAARSGIYELIIAVGPLLSYEVLEVAQLFPNQHFVSIHGGGSEPNLAFYEFSENESMALAGALAGLIAAHFKYSYVGIVLGADVEWMWDNEAAYRWGVYWGLNKYYNVVGVWPDVHILADFTNSFIDIAQAMLLAGSMLAQGAGVVCGAAGPADHGVRDAVEDELIRQRKTAGPPFMIESSDGCDWDWRMDVSAVVVASSIWHWDKACYEAIEAYYDRAWIGGCVRLGVEEGAVGLSMLGDLLSVLDLAEAAGAIPKGVEHSRYSIIFRWASARASIPFWIWESVNELEADIRAGRVTIPYPYTREEIKDVRARWP